MDVRVMREELERVALAGCPRLYPEERAALIEQFSQEFDEASAVVAYFTAWLQQPRHIAMHHSNLRNPT